MKPSVSLRRIISKVLGDLSKLQILWKEWDLRGFIVASFTLQLILIFIGPFRKQTSNGVIILSIWLSYLLADWVAVQAVGFVSKTPRNDVQDNLFALWAQFLLLHLGGPDTITALAIEDNKLWLRTGLQLATQVYATFGVLVKSVRQSILWAPTILMFFVGVIKYVERLLSLLNGRLTNFDQSPDYYYYHLREHAPLWEFTHTPLPDAPITQSKTELPNVEMVRGAFFFFHYHKGLFADRIFNFAEWRHTRDYFLRRTSEEAFRVVEIELNFAYEILYTKMVIIHEKVGKVLRPIAMFLEVGCFVLWCFTKKHGFHSYDIGITCTLFIGAIVVDFLSLFRILLSIWNIAILDRRSTFRDRLYERLLSAWDRTWGEYWSKEEAPTWAWVRRVFFRRWSESVSQFNLINFCVDGRSNRKQKTIEFFYLKDVLDGLKYVTTCWFPNDFRKIIFKKLWLLSVGAMEAEPSETVYEMGDWAPKYETYLVTKGFNTFLDCRVENATTFGETLLAWHIATEICYQLEIEVTKVDDKKETLLQRIYGHTKRLFLYVHKMCKGKYSNNGRGIPSDRPEEVIHREFSKVVSDYMLYLVIRQPIMVPNFAGISKVRFEETCKVIKELLKEHYAFKDLMTLEHRAVRHQETCRYLLNEMETIHFWTVSNPVLKHGLELAQKLQELKNNNRSTQAWELTAGLWILGLCYAGKHCKPRVHAAQLKQGGELLSVVWLLMVRFGLRQVDIGNQ